MSTSHAGEPQALTWIASTSTPLALDGLPYLAQNSGHWWRFPESRSKDIPDYVWSTSQAPSGARVRLRTNASELVLRGTLGPVGLHDNTSRFGAASFDLYIDDQYCRSIVPPQEGDFESVLLSGIDPHDREICIYAPLFSLASIHAIGVNPQAKVESPQPYAVAGAVVFYGTSITHGGCASRSGLSWPAQVCRKLNLNLVNFGMNGCGRGEREVGQILAGVDAAAYVLDYSQNNASSESLQLNYTPFIEALRAQHPTTPIICITPIYWTTELKGTAGHSIHEANRNVIRNAVAARKEAGDQNIYLVEGFDLLGPELGDGLTDGLHPNTLGFHWMAENFAPTLSRVLGL